MCGEEGWGDVVVSGAITGSTFRAAKECRKLERLYYKKEAEDLHGWRLVTI